MYQCSVEGGLQGGSGHDFMSINPIRSGGRGFKSPPPPIFCSHAFNFGAALLCAGDFSQKIV